MSKALEVYSYETALKDSTEYFKGDELSARVFVDKYSLRNNEDQILENTPEKTHKRLAKEFARVEKKYENPMSEEEIFSYFQEFKEIVPQGSPMSAIGNPYQIQSSSNCLTIESPWDSYGGILKTDQELTQLAKRRCGIGFDISTIRPKGTITKNSAKTTDGIGVFMERFSNSCREVAQNGRRGALLLSISVHHPEIKTFINIKKDKKKVTGANVSIRISDEFMKAVKNDSDYELRWPVDAKVPKISQMVKAKEIWDEIISAAWESAEPGVLFWDTATKMTPSDAYTSVGFGSVSCNPCSEIILSKYDSCRLMIINIASFVKNPFTNIAEFDFERFKLITFKAQRLMDDMVDIELEHIDGILSKIEKDPEPDEVKRIEKDLWIKIKDACQKGRRMGLGITGLGDTLAYLGIRYGSKESIVMTENIYKELCINSYKSSAILAKERGAFPIYDAKLEKKHEFIQRVINADEELKTLHEKYGRRNIALLTTAPVGSVSMLTKTTSGIEPVFAVEYKRRKKISSSDKDTVADFVDAMGDRWQEFIVYHHGFKKWMETTSKTKVEESPYHKATANEIDWMSSVEIQSVAQRWICHAISKTCNLPNSATKQQVAEVYMKAFDSGCKGFTVYREGCRDGVLINNSPKKVGEKIVKTHAPKRPQEIICDVHHVKITKKLDKVRQLEYAVIVGLFNEDPYEIFVFENGTLDKKYSKGLLVKKARGHYSVKFDDGHVIENITKDQTEEEEMTTRLVSTSLRHGADISFIVHQLEKVKADSFGTFTKVMARVLKKYIKDGTKVSGEVCPSCSSKNLQRKEGCVSCTCGFSKCN